MFAPLTYVQVDAIRRLQTTGIRRLSVAGGAHGRVH
jgi:tyrosyl-tRNA synthetase